MKDRRSIAEMPQHRDAEHEEMAEQPICARAGRECGAPWSSLVLLSAEGGRRAVKPVYLEINIRFDAEDPPAWIL